MKYSLTWCVDAHSIPRRSKMDALPKDLKELVLKNSVVQIAIFVGMCVLVGWQAQPYAAEFIEHEAQAMIRDHVRAGAHDEANLNHYSIMEIQYSSERANIKAEKRDYESRVFTRRDSDDPKLQADIRYYEKLIEGLEDDLDELEPQLVEIREQKKYYLGKIQSRSTE